MIPKSTTRRWLRKRQVRTRYGEISDRALERAVKAGRIPAPEFPTGSRVPMWREDLLDLNDHAAALARREPGTTGRPFRKSEGAVA